MSAPRDWTAENFAASLAFDEHYHGARWAGADAIERDTSMQTARSYYLAGWRAHIIAQRSLDFEILKCPETSELETLVTHYLRDGWTLAGPPFVFGKDVCQAMTRGG